MNDLTQSDRQDIIIYRTADGRASVALYAKDGKIWLNQQQMAELFATSKQAISHHIANILKERELEEFSVVKHFLTTAADGKNYNVVFYSLEMIIAVGYRVRGIRGTQFRQWATEHLTEYLTKTSSRAKAALQTKKPNPLFGKYMTISTPSANNSMPKQLIPMT